MKYERILTEVLSTPWAIRPDMLSQIAAILALRASGHRFTNEELEARVAAGQARAALHGGGSRHGLVAVLPILGVLIPRGEALQRTSGAVSIQQLSAEFDRLVADTSVSAIVLDVDSGGGSVGGIEEFAQRVYDATSTKPVVAIGNPTMASAAFWIGASASEVIVSPSSLTGAVGVFAAHEDLSVALEKAGVKVTLVASHENKVLGNQFEPLSAEARAEIQKRVDQFANMFVRSVARGRGVTQRDVRERFGAGAIFGAKEAVDRKLADRVGTLEDAIALAAQRAGRPGRSPAAASSAYVLPAYSASEERAEERAEMRIRMAELGL